MKYFTDADLDKLVFFQVPKILILGDQYKRMNPNTKILYIVLIDRMKLSMQNGWKEDGQYYVRMSAQKAAELLGFSESTFKRAKKELATFELMAEKQEGLTKTNKLFIGQLEYDEADIYKLNHEVDDLIIEAEQHAEKVDESLKGQNDTSQSYQLKGQNDTSRKVKMNLQEVSKRTSINNDFKKNKLNKNNHSLTIVNLQATSENENSLLNETTKISHEKLFIETCNEFYTHFSTGRWDKKTWNKIVKQFVIETIESNRHVNVPPYKRKGYVYKALESIALSHDLKHKKIELVSLKAVEQTDTNKVPFYNWLEER